MVCLDFRRVAPVTVISGPFFDGPLRPGPENNPGIIQLRKELEVKAKKPCC